MYEIKVNKDSNLLVRKDVYLREYGGDDNDDEHMKMSFVPAVIYMSIV